MRGDPKKRGFSRAVAPGEDYTFAGRNFQVNVAKSENPTITLFNSAELEAGGVLGGM